MEEVEPTLADVLDSIQALVVMQMRIADLLMVIAAKSAPEKTAQLLELHKNGKIAGPKLWYDPESTE